ncbi:MAG: hypothetical protein ACHREM_03380 [Polyangiales bacterium]
MTATRLDLLEHGAHAGPPATGALATTPAATIAGGNITQTVTVQVPAVQAPAPSASAVAAPSVAAPLPSATTAPWTPHSRVCGKTLSLANDPTCDTTYGVSEVH